MCGSIKHLHIAYKDLFLGLAIRKAKILDLEMLLSQAEAKKEG